MWVRSKRRTSMGPMRARWIWVLATAIRYLVDQANQTIRLIMIASSCSQCLRLDPGRCSLLTASPTTIRLIPRTTANIRHRPHRRIIAPSTPQNLSLLVRRSRIGEVASPAGRCTQLLTRPGRILPPQASSLITRAPVLNLLCLGSPHPSFPPRTHVSSRSAVVEYRGCAPEPEASRGYYSIHCHRFYLASYALLSPNRLVTTAHMGSLFFGKARRFGYLPRHFDVAVWIDIGSPASCVSASSKDSEGALAVSVRRNSLSSPRVRSMRDIS